jgi:secreted trypsin-like serine protease
MSRAKSQPVEPSVTWACSCQPEVSLNTGEFRQHLVDKHGITDHRGSAMLLFHLDARDYYTDVREFTIGEVKATQTVMEPRWGGR